MTNRTDNFNRADSASSLGTPSDGGSSWVVLAGTWGITTNRAYSASAGSQEAAYLESDVSDAEIQVTLQSVPSLAEGALCFRVVDANNYCIVWAKQGTGFRLYERVAGAFTERGTLNATSPLAGDVIKVGCDGSSVTVYRNGAAMTGLTGVTITAHQTATKHGLRSHTDKLFAFEDFSITGLSAGSSIPAISNYYRMMRSA